MNHNYWPVYNNDGEIEKKNKKEYHSDSDKLNTRVRKMEIQTVIWIDGEKINFEKNGERVPYVLRPINHGGSDVWYFGDGANTPDFLSLQDIGDVEYFRMK